MKIWEKDGWIFVQLMDLTTGKMLIDFTVEKEAFNELRDHIIEHLIEFKLDSGEKEATISGLGGSYVGKSTMITNSKPESKNDDHQSEAERMIDDAFDRGDLP